MASFTFIHAADLHLGAPFRGLDTAAADRLGGKGAGNLLTEASFAALARLEQLCLDEKAAFLLLAGDIYDDADGVLRARFALRDMTVRLTKAGVRVFIAHGNHDPLHGGVNPLPWPDGVTVFGPKVQTEEVRRGDAVVALVHGVSHTGPKEKTNLAKLFSRHTPDLLHADMAADVFQIGLLHCCVGTVEGHMPYAPCALSDLTGTGLDYWALGHVHQGRTLSARPPVVYAGSLQGLHINESGPHGCCVVRVEGPACRVRTAPLAPVRWQTVSLDAAARDIENLDDLEQAVLGDLDNLARTLAAGGAPSDSSSNTSAGSAEQAAQITQTGAFAPTALFCRVRLEGHTDLDRVLRRSGALETVLTRLREALAQEEKTGAGAGSGVAPLPRIWLKDLVLHTSPVRDVAELAQREDLAGEVARLADQAASEDETLRTLAESALTDLYSHRRLKKVLTQPAGDELRELTAGARSLCCSLLESG